MGVARLGDRRTGANQRARPAISTGLVCDDSGCHGRRAGLPDRVGRIQRSLRPGVSIPPLVARSLRAIAVNWQIALYAYLARCLSGVRRRHTQDQLTQDSDPERGSGNEGISGRKGLYSLIPIPYSLSLCKTRKIPSTWRSARDSPRINPDRTVLLRGALRPGILVEEAEAPAGATALRTSSFCAGWGSASTWTSVPRWLLRIAKSSTAHAARRHSAASIAGAC